VALPRPAPGLVVSYAYLWRDQHRAGGVEGRKDRPCAIVVATTDEDGDTLVYVAPITHTEPAAGRGVEVPAGVKRRLGLGDARSWIITDELNRFIWPGFDLRPISRNRPEQFAYGFLPVEVFAAVTRSVLSHRQARRLGVIGRE
jgi:hypothetical protein